MLGFTDDLFVLSGILCAGFTIVYVLVVYLALNEDPEPSETVRFRKVSNLAQRMGPREVSPPEARLGLLTKGLA